MYLWLKLIHIAAVIAFLGNITTGVFWHRHAARTRNPRLLAHTMDGIIRSDRLFTNPGAFLLVASGIAAAIAGGHPILRTGWIFWALMLFAVSGLVFLLRVAPLQRQMRALAEAGVRDGEFYFGSYHRLARQWEFWGAVALLTSLAGLVLMVLKPGA